MAQPTKAKPTSAPSRRPKTAATKRSGGRIPGSSRARPNRPRSGAGLPTDQPPNVRWLLLTAAGLSLVGGLLLLLIVAPELQAWHPWLAILASFAPYGWLAWAGAVLAASFGARGRTRMIIAALVICLTWHTALISDYFPQHTPAGSGTELVVMEQNLRFGRANLNDLVNHVAQHRPDLVILTEVTESNQSHLSKAWRKLLPHQAGRAGLDYDPQTGRSDGTATMIFSRYPLQVLDRGPAYTVSNVAVRIQVQDQSVTVIAAHPTNPVQSLHQWLADYARLAELCQRHTSEPLIVAGDLNATAEHLPLRELKARIGLTDAALGQGWQPSFPAQWLPPLIQIDHVLATKQFQATGQQTLRVADTDHLGLLVTLQLAD